MGSNNRNYAKELERIITGLDAGHASNRSVLLHSCCAPCSSYVMEYLREYFDLTVFYYNPNITEDAEYRKRVEEQKRLIGEYNRQVETHCLEGMQSTAAARRIQVIEGDYEPACFFAAAKGMEDCPEGGQRCFACYRLRLEKTAQLAAQGGYGFFTTTLTISPLKNAGKLNEIGEELAGKYGVAFLPSDFKKKDGYKRSVELSGQFGLYRQDYCGCVYSKASAAALGSRRLDSYEKGEFMEKLLDLVSEEMKQAFAAAGYDGGLGNVTPSNRPDLCEYQCNGAMAGAKQYKKAPMAIAQDVVNALGDSKVFAEAGAVNPGFLNLKLNPAFVRDYLERMARAEKFGLEMPERPKKIVIDYGGPNVAKPLHVGHLRSAIIGESVKRIARYAGHEVTGDIHLGDWGLQMGLIITELRERQPDLLYFEENYEGEYPAEAPFTISELEEIYPTASAKSKEDAAYKEKAMDATFKLQSGVRGYRALWNHIMDVSVADLKKNYKNLNVEFDLWKGESDVHDLIPAMVDEMKKGGYAYLSEGALVVDVKEETDTKEVPPCMILKSDGASLYNTTDLATIMDRMDKINPDEIIYVVDKRQELYFEQVFRCARKTGLVRPETELKFLGFGTMNGKDGKPFKTREGGVMRLESLLEEINGEMYRKIMSQENRTMPEGEAGETAKIVALSAVKYGDLSNQASKDYIFDIDRFTSSEGDTGPYILYTIARMKSILGKYEKTGEKAEEAVLQPASGESEKSLMLQLAGFNAMMEGAYAETAPHKVCSYIYDLANAFNRFYHETKILTEDDQAKKGGWIALLALTRDVLETCIGVLGFSAPDRM